MPDKLGGVGLSPMVSELRHSHGHAQARQQGKRELDAVMGMKLQFRQQVSAGDAQECAGAEG